MILGLNTFHGDSSAAIFRSGELTFALEEERFNRVKHWAGLPLEAARVCLAGEAPAHVAISRDPSANLRAKLVRAVLRPANWNRYASRAKNSIRVAQLSNQLVTAGISSDRTKFHFVEHHRAHLASASSAPPLKRPPSCRWMDSAIFPVLCGASAATTRSTSTTRFASPTRWELFYTAFTQFLGFPKYGDEYKMMGMSAYGEPRFVDKVRDVVKTRNGACRLNLDYFTHHTKGVDMTWDGGEPAIGPGLLQ